MSNSQFKSHMYLQKINVQLLTNHSVVTQVLFRLNTYRWRSFSFVRFDISVYLLATSVLNPIFSSSK